MVDQIQINLFGPTDIFKFHSLALRKNNQHVEPFHIDEILHWTRSHTYHTQYFCNRLFAQKIEVLRLWQLKKSTKKFYTRSNQTISK